MDSLYIIIPAYNEESNIKSVIETWYPIIEKNHGNGKSRLVILDDGSFDDTYRIICECKKDRPLLTPLTKQNEGHGATILKGYQYAIEHGADYVFQTDSDGQTLPSEFQPFWNDRKRYDMVIGRRDARQDGLGRIFVAKVLKWTVAGMFGVCVLDANVPYRLMKAERLKEIITFVPEGYNLTNVIVSVVFQKMRYSVKSIPITFRPRQGGANSIHFKKIAAIGYRAIRSFYKINKELDKIEKNEKKQKRNDKL